MREFPLYGGPSLQTAKADPGVAARAANGDQGQVLGASVQKAEEAVQGSAEAFARISDFGDAEPEEHAGDIHEPVCEDGLFHEFRGAE